MSFQIDLERAIRFTIDAFGKKVRAGPRRIPTYTHSLRVGLALIQYDEDPDVIIAGILHDVLEDTGTALGTLTRMFGPIVAILVQSCSHNPQIGDTPEGEREMLEHVIQEAARGHVAPLKIKIVDKDDNLQTNRDLKAEYQTSQYLSGRLLLEAGRKYLPGYRAVDNLEITLNREKQRLGL